MTLREWRELAVDVFHGNVMALGILLSSCFLLSGCAGSDKPEPKPVPANPPPVVEQPPAIRRKKEFFYFTAMREDLDEVRGHVTAVWAKCWGDSLLETRQLLAAQMPAIGEWRECMFDGDRYRGDEEGAAMLRTVFQNYQLAGVLQFICKLYIDEPPFPREVVERAVAIVRAVCAEYPELAGVRMMVCIGDNGRGDEDYSLVDLFDDIAVDAYGERASIATPGGRLDRLAYRLTDEQRFYAVPGTNTGVGALTPAEFEHVVQFVLDHPRGGGIMPFTWFDRVDEHGVSIGQGARSTELRQPCIDAGLRVLAWNADLSGGGPA